MASTSLKPNKSWETKSTEKHFWSAIDIFINKTHIINRRLIGVQILKTYSINNNVQLADLVNDIIDTENNQNVIKEENNVLATNPNDNASSFVILKRIFPKNTALGSVLEIVLKDYNETQVNFINTCKSNLAPSFQYAFSYHKDQLKLWLEEGVSETDPSVEWLIARVVPKLLKWMESAEDKGKADNISSLSLVQVSDYCTLYNKLKETYGKQLVEIWPENTDPLKFVYEDIGIATYLLLLWAGKPKQRFVDLGCGNGLLVHILNSEGHIGVGYDIRPRKIWSLFPSETTLEVCTIIPSSDTVFPDADWLIGNHSDELTVWLPVMALRSSYSCNFFVLPCCAYEFTGQKYCRVDTSVSQYSDFLSYVGAVCDVCGFVIEKDKLRIPSTKRTCFVGRTRNYSESKWKGKMEMVKKFVDSKCVFKTDFIQNCSEVLSFKPRPEERVRNCTQIHSDIRQSIVSIVSGEILAKKRSLESGLAFGGVVELSTLVKVIPSDLLKQLKNECGGLQTLLKNHSYIFKVKNGKVEFRIPTEKSESDSVVWKKKPCWFYHNHPSSCPLLEEKCSFIH